MERIRGRMLQSVCYRILVSTGVLLNDGPSGLIQDITTVIS